MRPYNPYRTQLAKAFDLRLTRDLNRQGHFVDNDNKTVESYAEDLKNWFDKICPYIIEDYEFIEYVSSNTSVLDNGSSCGPKAKISGDSWIYSIQKVRTIANSTGTGKFPCSPTLGWERGWKSLRMIRGKRDRLLKADIINVWKEVKSIYARMPRKPAIDDPNTWPKLDLLTTGRFEGDTCVTWWTTFPINPQDIIEARNRLGIVIFRDYPLQDLIPEDENLLVVIACRMSDVKDIFIPNSIAAFAYPVFDAQSYHDTTLVAGSSLNIGNLAHPLQNNVPSCEVTAKGISVDKIYVYPVHVQDMNQSRRKDVSWQDPNLHQRLIEFYEHK